MKETWRGVRRGVTTPMIGNPSLRKLTPEGHDLTARRPNFKLTYRMGSRPR